MTCSPTMASRKWRLRRRKPWNMAVGLMVRNFICLSFFSIIMLKQTYLSFLICIKLNFVFRNINSWARAVRQEISGLYFWCNWVIYDLISINPVTFTTKPQPSSCSHQKTRVFLLILIIKCRVLIFDPAVCVF